MPTFICAIKWRCLGLEPVSGGGCSDRLFEHACTAAVFQILSPTLQPRTVLCVHGNQQRRETEGAAPPVAWFAFL